MVNRSIQIVIAALLMQSSNLFSVTEYKHSSIAFTSNMSDLKSSLSLPMVVKESMVKIPIKKLKIRALNFGKDERVEPVQIYFPHDPQELEVVIKEVALAGREALVEAFIKSKIDLKTATGARTLLDIPKKELMNFNLNGIASVMARTHQNIKILTKDLNLNEPVRKEFLSQLKFFLGSKQRIHIAQKLKKGRDLTVNKDLLPRFARKMLKKFVVFKGPNCFHAALAFHDQILTRSEEVNVKEEAGYHRAMINYDELWRAISRHFYEVDPQKSPMKYGDMLVFFNLPDDASSDVNFRWIRHTATYLFGEYTFSKGSKSPNTPYTVKTLADEWNTWQRYTKKLGVKIFRRANRKIEETPPEDLTDWIF